MTYIQGFDAAGNPIKVSLGESFQEMIASNPNFLLCLYANIAQVTRDMMIKELFPHIPGISMDALNKQVAKTGYDDVIPFIGKSLSGMVASPQMESDEMFGLPPPVRLDKCPKCQTDMTAHPTWKVCPTCQVSLYEGGAEPAPPAPPLKCACGEELQVGWPSCPACQAPAAPPPPPPPPMGAPPASSIAGAPAPPPAAEHTMPCNSCNAANPASAWQAKVCVFCGKDPGYVSAGTRALTGFSTGIGAVTTGAVEAAGGINAVKAAGTQVQTAINTTPPPPPPQQTCTHEGTYVATPPAGGTNYYCYTCRTYK